MPDADGIQDAIGACRLALRLLKEHRKQLECSISGGSLSRSESECLKEACALFSSLSAVICAADGSASQIRISALPDLVLLRLFEFLGGSQGCRAQLGTLRLVCKRWKGIAEMDELWGPVTLDLWPVEDVERKEGGQGAGRPWASSLFKLCLYRAHCLQRAGVTIVTPQWPSHYDISFEMHDRWDGLCLFSGYGPLVLQEWHNANENRTILRMGAQGARVVATPFCAAGRSPTLRDIRQYFSLAHLPDQRTSLCFRVVAVDRRTGREALLYESGKHTDRHVQDAANGWPVPPSSIAVTDHAGTWLCSKAASSVGPMRALFDFTVVPVEDPRPDQPPQQRLHTVHCAQVDPPTNTVQHRGIVGLVFLGHVHEVGILLASLEWT